MKKTIRVGIVDDHPGVRIAIRQLLSNAKDVIVVGEGINGAEALQIVDQEAPDVLLLDVELPVMRGDEVLQRLRDNGSGVKVLALSSYNDPMYVLGMLENGADGYLTKEEAPNFLLAAVRSIIHDGVKWISPLISKHVSQVVLNNKIFTGRELEILRSIVIGISDGEIIRTMELEKRVFDRYIELLMEKFGVPSRKELKVAAKHLLSTTSS